ncbi:MAG TPA: 3-hydroxyacyl-CoA dehydrogenase NAD-binding domain-containing protein [Candidatus Baltobacteraceae bacterium]
MRIEDRAGARTIVLNHPPVNALSFAYCARLLEAIEEAQRDPAITALIFTGANGLFSGGADVNDFNGEPAPESKSVRDVVGALERAEKICVAAIDGNALGGALELCLACDYRVATPRSKVGLPEVKLGLLPGAGGTQRLPRLIGARAALEFMLEGKSVDAATALELGILDEIARGDVVNAAIALAAGPKRRVSARAATLGNGITMQAVPFVVSQAHKMVPPEDRGGYAAHKLIDAVEASVELPFALGIAREARLFDELVRSAPSAALRHLFFAQRELGKIPGLPAARALPIATAGVVGAGTMGTGIAIALAEAGIACVVVDADDAAIEKAKQTVFGMFAYRVQKGKLTPEEAWKRGQSILFTDDFAQLADADVAIEAVFESMAVKKDVLARVDAIVKPACIIASNTSTLDIDEMAAATARPDRFLGLHFFVPANIMPLLEIVRGAATSPQTLATAFALGKALHKTSVLSGNAFGFIGNRMIFDYVAAAGALAEEGIPPARIDAAMTDFGFAMGPFAMVDLSGIDIAQQIARVRPDVVTARTKVLDRLVEMKRLGQKTMAGYYVYDRAVGKGRQPIHDPEIDALFAREAAAAGIAPRDASDDEIRERLLRALADRGSRLLEEGVALRPGDIDVVCVYGYGFPPYHGGPMWYAAHEAAARV